jgi:hypothetical protein
MTVTRTQPGTSPRSSRDLSKTLFAPTWSLAEIFGAISFSIFICISFSVYEHLLLVFRELEERSFLDKAQLQRSLAGSETQQEASLRFLYGPLVPAIFELDVPGHQRLEHAGLAPKECHAQVLIPKNV